MIETRAPIKIQLFEIDTHIHAYFEFGVYVDHRLVGKVWANNIDRWTSDFDLDAYLGRQLGGLPVIDNVPYPMLHEAVVNKVLDRIREVSLAEVNRDGMESLT